MALPDGAALRRWKTVTWARQSAILVAAEGDEQQGSQSYVLGQAKDDKALQAALALIRGTETNPAFPPNPKQTASEP